MSATELAALVCCDLGAIVRGRSLPAAELAAHEAAGVGWVPANLALTPLGGLAEPNPFGSTGDLRLLPDLDTHVHVEPDGGAEALDFVLCDIAETDGSAWECCPRAFLREALDALDGELGLRVRASFEHEFQLLGDAPAGLPFSLRAQRLAEPFPSRVFGALQAAGVAPERFMAEFAARQFEIPVEPADGLVAADRAVILREVVRDVARQLGLSASFAPLLDVQQAGNGVHIHLSLLDADGRAALHDPSRPAALSELGGSFAAGILAHAGALNALTASSPLSAARLQPHRWSAGAACLAQRNREALLRLPPLVAGAGAPAGRSCAWSTAAATRRPTRTSRSARSSAPGSTASARARRAADPRARPGAARRRGRHALRRRRAAELARRGAGRVRRRRRRTVVARAAAPRRVRRRQARRDRRRRRAGDRRAVRALCSDLLNRCSPSCSR